MSSYASSKKDKNTLNNLTPTRKRSARNRKKAAAPVSLSGNIQGTPPLLIDAYSLQGRRPYQEDRVSMIIDLVGSCPHAIDSVRNLQTAYGQWSRMSLFCVCDGHAGARAADYVIANLPGTFWSVVPEVLASSRFGSDSDRGSGRGNGNGSDNDRRPTTHKTTPPPTGNDALNQVEKQLNKMHVTHKPASTPFAATKQDTSATNTSGGGTGKTTPTNTTFRSKKDTLICNLLKCTLATLDAHWLERVKNSRVNDGSCVLVALLIDDRWFFAHLGDCRAIFVRGNTAKNITKDHTPGVDKKETIRIQKAGGRLEKRPGGVHRVCAGGTKIAVTRAIGDANMKRLRTPDDTPVLSSNADTSVVSGETLKDDFTIVMVSDGVTSKLNNKKIAACLRAANVENHSNLSQYLVERAYQNGSFDNISALIIRPQQ